MRNLIVLLTLGIAGCGPAHYVVPLVLQLDPTPYTTTAIGPFKVDNGHILNGNGDRFVVNGVTMFDYVFYDLGGAPYWLNAYGPPEVSLDKAKAIGINLIRIMIRQAIRTSPDDPKYLDHIIDLAAERGIVVELQNVTSTPVTTDEWETLAFIANRYKNNTMVWINIANEVNCQGYYLLCGDAALWENTVKYGIRTVRGEAFTGPVIINTINYSDYTVGHGYGTSIEDYLAPDFDSNMIIGIHRYADLSSTDPQIEITNWAQSTGKYAITIDEIGYVNVGSDGQPTPPNAGWSRTMLDFLSDWTNLYGGSGVIAMSWYADFACNAPGIYYSCLIYKDGSLSDWGTMYKTLYLDKINSTL